MELKKLQQRVSELEHLVAQLVKWTRFGLDKLKIRSDDDEDDDEYKSRKHSRRNGHNHRTKETKSSRKSGVSPKRSAVAKKSTGGVRRSGRSPRNRNTNAEDTFPTFRLGLVNSDPLSPRAPIQTWSNVPIKIENIYSEAEAETTNITNYDTILPDVPDLNKDDTDDGFDFAPPGDDDYNPMSDSDSDSDSDSQMTCEIEPTSLKKSRPSKLRPRKPKFPPLRIPTNDGSLENGEKKVQVVMEKLTQADLQKMNVVVPPPRHFPSIRTPHKCQCGFTFTRKTEFVKHQKVHRGPREKKKPKERCCPHCEKLFYHKNAFQNHLRVHTGERPYLCWQCGHGAKTLQMLKDHVQRIHEADPNHRPVKCDECEKTFRYKNSLAIHKRKAHGPQGVNVLAEVCKLCAGSFTDKSKLKRHVDEMHEEKRQFQCHLCNQQFKRPAHLKKHIERHQNPKRRRRGPQISMFKRRCMQKEVQKGKSEDAEIGLNVHKNSESDNDSNEEEEQAEVELDRALSTIEAIDTEWIQEDVVVTAI